VSLQQHGLEVRQVLFSLETLDTLVLVLLDPAHLGIDLTLFSLDSLSLLLQFSLTEELVDALVEVEILEEVVIGMLSKQLAGQKLFDDLGLELLEDVLSVHSQHLLLSLLLQFLNGAHGLRDIL